VIVERTEHPEWLSNAYLLADREGGHAVLVDSNGLNAPLLAKVDELGVTVTHVLVTHHHHDHVVTCAEDADRFGVPVVGHALAREAGVRIDETVSDGDVLRSGGFEIRVLATPGHCRDHLAFLAGGTDCLTADCLFKGTVGGTVGGGPTGYEDQVRSIMDVLLGLPPETVLHPGHSEPTTVGAEWESNPFVRVWRGLDPEGAEPCRVRGQEATLVLWGPDYDGTHKAWVRYADGRDAIVGGSQVERGTAS
jgi:glyoxylase-like metal-dependent hydrolase (beta-lactamase superfamily II)